MRALMTTAAHAANKILTVVEPWYDWGTREVSRLDAHCREFTDESYRSVPFFEVQWFGIHVELQIGRTPKKRPVDKIAANQRGILAAERQNAHYAELGGDEDEAHNLRPSPLARHLQLVRDNATSVTR
jgi:hypothetical protein